jgi:predicted CXXCH cytochrome family protein
MRALVRILCAAAVLASAAAAALAGDGGCGVCHGKERVTFDASVHNAADVGCVTCHGGDDTAVDSKEKAHAADKGFRGKLGRLDVAEACGNCHSDVARMRPFALRTDSLAAYRASHHGKATFGKKDTEAATCSDCHGVHDVRHVKDPLSPAFHQNVPTTCAKCHDDAALMKRHGIVSHAVADYTKSVHGTLLARGEPGVPSCADCHDAHAASPPGALEVADVCGACHRETRDRFRESPHFTASKSGGMHECITCHGNHAVQRPGFSLFDATDDAVTDADGHGGTRCLTCHDPGKPADKGYQTAISFGRGLRGAESEIRDAAARVDSVESQGFHVDDERESLDQARRALIRALPLTHTANRALVEGELRRTHSLVEQATFGCDAIVREERDRRIFGSVAGAVLLGIAGVLGLRRRIARKG